MILEMFKKAWQEGTEIPNEKPYLEQSINDDQGSSRDQNHNAPTDADITMKEWMLNPQNADNLSTYRTEGDASHQLKPQETRRTITEPEGITYWFE